jgi:transposase
MPMLADSAELVIGVDTHKHTHTAAVVTAATGAMVAQATVPATPAGYRQLLELADQHHGQRVWAIEGTGGYGAGLTRFLTTHAEQVVELDRPKRAPAAMAPSLIRWTRSGPPARCWAVISWPSPERPVHEPRCRCGWPPVARRSRPPAMPTPTARAGHRRTRDPAGTAPDPLDPPARGRLRPAARPGQLGRGDRHHGRDLAQLGPSDPGAD